MSESEKLIWSIKNGDLEAVTKFIDSVRIGLNFTFKKFNLFIKLKASQAN